MEEPALALVAGLAQNLQSCVGTVVGNRLGTPRDDPLWHAMVALGSNLQKRTVLRGGRKRMEEVCPSRGASLVHVSGNGDLRWPGRRRRNSPPLRRQESQSMQQSPICFVAASATVAAPSTAAYAQPVGAKPLKKEGGGGPGGGRRKFEGLPEDTPITKHPTLDQLLAHPVAMFRYIPKNAALFIAGAFAGATAKSVTAPLDRVKLMMQVQSVQDAGSKKAIGMLSGLSRILKEEGARGLWKGNLPQVIRIIPYSAVQLFAYETYKRVFQGTNDELSVGARLAAGACAGMTSTLVTYPLDTLRLRLAVDPLSKSMGQVFLTMLRDEGLGSFYRGLGPSLLGIAPYIALNFCVFDLMKKSIPEEYQNRPEASFVTALCSATFATVMCYPLDTVRRQMQMKGSPFTTVFDAFPGIIKRDGVVGLYRGFLANALKNLPNSSIRLTTFDGAKNLIIASRKEFDRLTEEPAGGASAATPR